MKLLPSWIRDFVDLEVDDRQLADDLSMAGISVEGIDEHDGYSIYEVDITTNRVDAMNHYGVARECAAIYDTDLKRIDPKLRATSGAPNFRIYIQAPEQCARYSARIVRGVNIKPSPEYIARRLTLLGSRPINNAADATNYALWELGHPTHAFDLDLLEGSKIIVRLAREGEVIKTLDGVERKLTSQDLVIADAVKPVAIAGVMGGFDTMITEKTKNVLIESAWFDPASIRRTSRRLGMHTDASHRFERGADFGITPTAANRVAQLIVEAAGGQVEGDLIDAVGRRVERPTLELHRREVERILGQDITEFDTTRILKRLGFAVTPGRQHAVAASRTAVGSGGAHAAVVEEVADFAVQVPTWRLDVDREIDLIEEVARIYGYDKFPNTLPVFTGGAVTLPDETKENELRGRMLALGYDEAISLAFISHADAKAFATMEPVEIANPLSEEASVMRTSMIPGMLSMLAHNLNRGVNDVRLFESGKVYEKLGNGTGEYRRLAIGATGSAIEASVHQAARAYNFFDLKGDLESLLSAFQYNSVYYDAHTADYYHPGRSARIVMDGTTIGQFGQIHPRIASQRKLRQDAFVAELDLERLFKHSLRERHYTPIPRYPAVDRDFSFLFDDEVTFERIHQAVEALRIPEMRSFTPVEIFRGGNVPAGKYSVLLRAEFQSAERTLRDDEVQLWATQIVKALEALGGTQRA